MLQCVSQALNKRIDEWHVTSGAHIEHKWNRSRKKKIGCSTSELLYFNELDLVVFKITAFKMSFFMERRRGGGHILVFLLIKYLINEYDILLKWKLYSTLDVLNLNQEIPTSIRSCVKWGRPSVILICLSRRHEVKCSEFKLLYFWVFHDTHTHTHEKQSKKKGK